MIERRCDDCGFDGPALDFTQVPELLRSTTERWSQVLARPEVGRRPAPEVWSALEYAAHVRDVHELFAGRLQSMLTQDSPTFADWDQDAAAVDYSSCDPVEIDLALIEAAGECAGRYASVRPDQLTRRGVRGDGSVFTVETFARYHLHDVVHHLWDVEKP